MGVVSILHTDGVRDDDIGHGSFVILVHSNPMSSASSAGSISSSSSGHQHSHLKNLNIESHHFRGVLIRGAGKKNSSVGLDRPGHVFLKCLDCLVGILYRQYLIII